MNLFQIRLTDPADTQFIDLSMDDYIPEKSDGFGIPPITRHIENTPSQHGSVDRGFHLLPRRLTFDLKLIAKNPVEFYSKRDQITYILRPNISLAPCRLSFTFSDQMIWNLAVYCTELSFVYETGFVQHALFSLLAPNPVFVQQTPAIATYFNEADINTSKIITYPGLWLATPYPFSIRGPLTHPVIINLSASTKLDLNYTVPDNQTVVIDLRQSYKNIKLGSTSLLGYLSSDSNLDTFALFPAPEAPSGANLIQVTGSNPGANTRVTIAYTPVRLSI